MTMEYIRDTYNVPAKRGMKVEVYYWRSSKWVLAKVGKISSASHYLHIDGIPFHPTYGIVYFDEKGSVLLDTRDH